MLKNILRKQTEPLTLDLTCTVHQWKKSCWKDSVRSGVLINPVKLQWKDTKQYDEITKEKQRKWIGLWFWNLQCSYFYLGWYSIISFGICYENLEIQTIFTFYLSFMFFAKKAASFVFNLNVKSKLLNSTLQQFLAFLAFSVTRGYGYCIVVAKRFLLFRG